MRKIVKADYRKKWDQLFYENDFHSPITSKAQGHCPFAKRVSPQITPFVLLRMQIVFNTTSKIASVMFRRRGDV